MFDPLFIEEEKTRHTVQNNHTSGKLNNLGESSQRFEKKKKKEARQRAIHSL